MMERSRAGGVHQAYVNIKVLIPAALSPWIYRIAHNEFVNNIKKRQKERDMFPFLILTRSFHTS